MSAMLLQLLKKNSLPLWATQNEMAWKTGPGTVVFVVGDSSALVALRSRRAAASCSYRPPIAAAAGAGATQRAPGKARPQSL